jgi:hypothetical protein
VKVLEQKKFPRTNWGLTVSRISRDLNRKGNQAAHDLARFALVEPNKTWSNFFPFCILSYIPSDMEGVS